jgi:protein TonB
MMKILKFVLLFFLLLFSISIHAQEIDKIYDIVEEMPVFPGCDTLTDNNAKRRCTENQLMKYINKNIIYPDSARDNNIQGLVLVEFVIDTQGKVTRIKILRDIGAGCGDAVVQAINKMNTDGIIWKPGKQGGKKVLVRYRIPARFRISN